MLRRAGQDSHHGDHGDLGWVSAVGEIYIVGRTSDGIDVAGASARDISPVHELEHPLLLEWDAADAAAIEIGDSPTAESNPATREISVDIVDCKNARADQLAAILRRSGIEGQPRLIPLPSISRDADGRFSALRSRK